MNTAKCLLAAGWIPASHGLYNQEERRAKDRTTGPCFMELRKILSLISHATCLGKSNLRLIVTLYERRPWEFLRVKLDLQFDLHRLFVLAIKLKIDRYCL